MIKHFFKKKQKKNVVFRNIARFSETLRVFFSRTYTSFKTLLAFFKVSFRKWVLKTFFTVINFCKWTPWGKFLRYQFLRKGKSVPWNFYIPGNCFDKIDYPSKSSFQITVHEKLLVNDKWLQARKGATANFTEKKQ